MSRCWRGRAWLSFAPTGLVRVLPAVPRARALGYILRPLRGWFAAFPRDPRGLERWAAFWRPYRVAEGVLVAGTRGAKMGFG